MAPVAHGLTTWKGSTSGYWDIPTNWAGGFPASNSTVRLNHDRQTNSYTVTVQSQAITDKLWMDTYADVPVHVRVSSAGSLQLNSMRMGFKEEDRESSFTIDGGSVWGMDPTDPSVTNTAFLIGNNPDCIATMSVLNEGTLSVQGSNGLIVASSKESIGRLVVANGNVRIKDSLTLGKGPDSLGELYISGTSSVSITGALHVAKLELGALAPTGTVHVAGGTLECGTLNIGANGVGSFTLSDGQVRALDGGITLGQANSTAQLNIYGGSMETAGSSMNIGHLDSTGTLFMANGNLNIDGAIGLGSASRSMGTLDLTGGTITSKELIIGAATSSTGIVHLQGGEIVILGSLNDSIQVSNGVLRIEKALVKWNNPNITDWITNAVANGTIAWSNGLPYGTYSANGFDGSFTNEGSTLYWDNLDNGSSFTQSVIWVEESPYNTWAGDYLLSGSNALWSADPDQDGFDNLSEYGLGGNPVNGFNPEIVPAFQILTSSGQAEYIYRQRSDPAAYGLTYYLELNTNLTTQSWTTNGYTLIGGSQDIGGFRTVTNQVPTGGNSSLFIRLQIQYE
ncbi:hypothetical protein SCARR_05218 [Pontiella sulfatireligans]|uniref:Uncharacterized protein n=2 Tax=Pontiella sulfatireligans TaxID=2750658 RepID=A0A6C2US30_9BACT|nr:hypothetical protein SCARR_05218 [Pontiella sulfatireligans]